MRARGLFPVILLASLAACDTATESGGDELVIDSGFEQGIDGWVVGFADYPPINEEIYELKSGIATLPAPLDQSRRALFISGSNRSDDLFMFAKRPVDGLAPNAVYRVRYEIVIASNEGSGCFGVSGAPGEAVIVKAGASTKEPVRVLEQDGWYRVGIDKGNQSAAGREMVNTDHIANGSETCSEGPYRLKSIDSSFDRISQPNRANVIEARSDSNGRVWLIVGTDSGYEGITTLYYDRIRVSLERV